jgi:putative transposase
MPYRRTEGDVVYHVLNRASDGLQLFDTGADYDAFEAIVAEALEQVPVRIISYCVMPNHWHFILWPQDDRDASEFMHWLTMTHAKRWRAFRGSTGRGHVYQGVFKSFPVQSDRHFLTVCRYVERNALRAGLVGRAEDWRWCSLFRREQGDAEARKLLADGPLGWPDDWLAHVNEPLTAAEIEAVRRCIRRGEPYGNENWVARIARRLGLAAILNPRGRPRKFNP